MHEIATCLWFERGAEEAARFYVSLLPNSRIDDTLISPTDTPSGKAGEVLTVEFTLNGQRYIGLNGGSHHELLPAVSISVLCEDQAEVDRIWNAFLENGGAPKQCGWLTDRFGVPWQIVPRRLMELMKSKDAATARKAAEAMMQMIKLDVAELERAVG